jgi:hypothetical protein
MQKGGLVDNKKLQQEISQQIAHELQLDVVDRAYTLCLEKIIDYLPRDKYSEENRIKLCQFLVEHRDDLVRMGYNDTSKFLNMFTEMMNKLIENEGISPDQAFTVVFRASERFI